MTVTTSRDDKVSVSEEKCYQRVLSECYERQCVVADERRELKRFSTCLKKEPQRQLCYVENMSKEEFNRTVEEFIAKHKRMQREEQEQQDKKQHDSCGSEVRDLSSVFKETVTAVTETTTMTCCTTVTASGDDKVSVSEEKCYRRVLSECYERRCVVEKMSKEEFNRTVEEFIAKHKRMQREEQLPLALAP